MFDDNIKTQGKAAHSDPAKPNIGGLLEEMCKVRFAKCQDFAAQSRHSSAMGGSVRIVSTGTIPRQADAIRQSAGEAKAHAGRLPENK